MMRYDAKFLIKLALIFFGLLFLLCVWLGRKDKTVIEAPEGEKIAAQDVAILLDALGVSVDMEKDAAYLTYGQYIAIYNQVDGETLGLPDYAERYLPEHAFLKADWYEAYRLLLAHFDTQSSIWETTVFVLKVNPETKEAYTESGAMQGSFVYCSAAFEENVFQEMKVYVKDGKLLTIVEVLPEEHYLGNVWVMESIDGEVECFYRQVNFKLHMSAEDSPERERVVDFVFRDGRVKEAKEKNEKVHGKLLRVSQGEMEIEGCGVYEIAEGMEIYRLYGSLDSLRKEDLKIGYDDTDFVIERNRVCACLVSKEETADRIRVLLKNKAENSLYYDAVTLSVDGETVTVEAKEMETGERRKFQSGNLTDKVVIECEGISREDNAYRGTVECYRAKEGIVLINELPLEEYLYAVVPSEMPASYPIEALKAQAVCARTYAYRFILHAGLPETGAHVDDTTAYQVYHNCKENAATTTAVKETAGVILTYEGEPAQNYYYSTSCGVGTDAAVWKSGGGGEISYLKAARIVDLQEEAMPQRQGRESGQGSIAEEAAENYGQAADDFATGLQVEENFRAFISEAHEEDIEKEEPWYRWTYTVKEIDEKKLLARMQERYKASPASVLTKAEGDYYVSAPVEAFDAVQEIYMDSRGAGGVADALVIVTSDKTYKIIAEYNIRYVLCDGKSEVIRQDDSAVKSAVLLPSGFFAIETSKSDENVIGYTLVGGGYGHGVGMSQNGAKALAGRGASYRQILELYYAGCEL